MKIKKALVVILAIILALNTVIYAAATKESLLKHYQEDFTYSNESIGRFLKSTTVKVEHIVDAELSYKPVVIHNDVLINTIVQLQREFPNVEPQKIYEVVVDEIYAFMSIGNTNTMDCVAGGTGSGVVISEDGFIATNHHVVETSEEEVIDFCIENYLYAIIYDNYESIVNTIESSLGEGILSEEQEDSLLEVLIGVYAENADVSVGNSSYTVYLPGADGETSDDQSHGYEATVVKIGGELASAEDGAILKISSKKLVAANLAKEYPASNSKVWAGGFPANADLDEKSNLAVTITEGTVSAIKKTSDSRYKVIQIDAGIDHGNSGGPSVDSKLAVLGLNTFGKTSDTKGNYNFMVPSEYVTDIAPQNLIIGDTSKLFLLGLQAMDGGYGKTAVQCFELVKQENPNIPYIDELIDDAKKLPQEAMSNINWMLIIILGVIVLVILIILIVIIAIIVSKSKGKKAQSYSSYQSSSSNTYGGYGGGYNNSSSTNDKSSFL